MRSRTGPLHARRPILSPLRGVYLPRTADAVAFALTTYGIPLLVLTLTRSASLTGLAFVLEWVPRLAAFGAAGAMVDRYGATRVFRWASIARALVTLAVAGALPSIPEGLTTTITVMVLAASTGMLTEFSFIAAETAGAAASRSNDGAAHRVQSVLLGIDQTATLAGPALGGLLLEAAGPPGMLVAIAFFSLLGAAIAPWYRESLGTEKPVPALQGLRVGWSTLTSLPTLSWLVAGLAVSNLSIGTLQAATPVIVVQTLGHSSASVGLIWSAAAAASLLTVAVCRLAIDRFGMWPVGAVAAAISSAACLAVATADSYPVYLTLIAVLLAGEGGMTVVLRTLRSQLIPANVFGSTLSLTILLLLLPFPAAGAVVALTPPQSLGHILLGLAVVQTLALSATFAKIRSHPLVRRTPEPAVA